MNLKAIDFQGWIEEHVERFEAVDYLPENAEVRIERCVGQHDEELRPGAVGSSIGHRQGSALVDESRLRQLIGDRVAGSPRPCCRLVAGLKDKPGHDTMGHTAVEVAAAGEEHERVHGLGCDRRIEFDSDIAA